MHRDLKRGDLIYPELSYELVGILFEVSKNLGSEHLEKHYQRALIDEFTKRKIEFKAQVPVPIEYKGNKIGIYFLDFLIKSKIVLEIKKNKNFSRNNIQQVYRYLKTLDLKLGILANFTDKGVLYKRILNID